jgi:cation diffusion facilitator family transporter
MGAARDEMVGSKQDRHVRDSKRSVIAALVANAAIAATKFVVAAVTGSSAMLSEAIHSTADSGNEVLLLIGKRRSRKAPDEIHPYGYGKEIFFWGLIVAVVLFGLGGGMSFYEGLDHLRHPHPVTNWHWALVVIGVALVLEGSSFWIAAKQFRARRGRNVPLGRALRALRDPSIYTVLGEDFAALLGLIVAAAGVTLSHVTGQPAWDGIASLVIGGILASVAVALVLKARRLLVGSGADQHLVERVREIARADRDVARAGNPLTMYLGPDQLLLNLDLQFRRGLTTLEIAAAVDRIEQQVRGEFPVVERIFIESENLRDEAAPAH